MAAEQRRAGYESEVREPRAVVGDFTFNSGRNAMQQLLDTYRETDAVFASNDEMALGRWRCCASVGFASPIRWR
jgi:DNA-binding LacI/PurR family transcriptional regulator